MALPDFNLSIVNYNTADRIGACLDSILGQEDVAIEVAVIDNASGDASLDVLRAYERDRRFRLIPNRENVGFGAAHNQVLLPQGRARYFGIINPDLEFRPGSLRQARAFLDARPEVGLLSPAHAGEDAADVVRHHYPREHFAAPPLPPLPGKIAWVIGACLFVRADLFRQVGGFDPGFFLYAEEIDLCLRLRRAGAEIAYDEGNVVRHIGGQSARHFSVHQDAYRRHVSLLRFYRKHYGAEVRDRIARSDRRKAFLRMRMIELSSFFSRKDPRAGVRYERYRGVADAIRDGAGKAAD